MHGVIEKSCRGEVRQQFHIQTLGLLCLSNSGLCTPFENIPAKLYCFGEVVGSFNMLNRPVTYLKHMLTQSKLLQIERRFSVIPQPAWI